MEYNNLEDIKKDFGFDTLNKAEIKSQLKQLLQSIHPDKHNGNFKNDTDRLKYDKIIAALDYIETPKEVAVKTELTALTKVVSELIQANKSSDKIQKYETELSRKIENSVKLYQSSHLFPKITASVITALITFIWLSPKTFADNPILSKYLSSSSLAFTIFWLTSLMVTIQFWFILYRKEQREQRLKSNLNLENIQNQIFNDFIKWKASNTNREEKVIRFDKDELIHFISNLRVTRNEIKYDEDYIERLERMRNFPIPSLSSRVTIDIEVSQSLSDLIIARAQKKELIELEKSKSLTDKYKITINSNME